MNLQGQAKEGCSFLSSSCPGGHNTQSAQSNDRARKHNNDEGLQSVSQEGVGTDIRTCGCESFAARNQKRIIDTIKERRPRAELPPTPGTPVRSDYALVYMLKGEVKMQPVGDYGCSNCRNDKLAASSAGVIRRRMQALLPETASSLGPSKVRRCQSALSGIQVPLRFQTGFHLKLGKDNSPDRPPHHSFSVHGKFGGCMRSRWSQRQGKTPTQS
eukprot:6468211-Amphidinium_carterae.1